MAPSMANTPGALPTPDPTLSPTKVLKRKAAKESDIFARNKRPKHNPSAANFGLEYEREQQKASEQLPIREDMLKGVVIPPQAIPKSINSAFKGGKAKEGDPGKMYRYAAMRGGKARVRTGGNVSKEKREVALARFPRLERERAEERVKGKEGFIKEVEASIEWWRRYVREEVRYNTECKEELGRRKFHLRCWKKVNYVATFQRGAEMEHRDVARFSGEFKRKWEEGNALFLEPVWNKDKARGVFVMEWRYNPQLRGANG